MMDAHMYFNNSLRCLLCLNWHSYPWAKDLYHEMNRSYETLRARIHMEELQEHQEEMERHEIENQQHEDEK